MSLYGHYIAERQGKHILEEDYGFLTYSFTPDGIYAEDLYISPAFRKSGLAAEFHQKLVELAKEKDLKFIYSSVQIGTPGANENLMKLMKNGARLHKLTDTTIYLSKKVWE